LKKVISLEKVKKKVNLYLDGELWEEFKKLAFMKHGNFHGALSWELEQALRAWLAAHRARVESAQGAQATLQASHVNPPPRTAKVWAQVKEYLRGRFGYEVVVSGVQIPRKHLIEAIVAVRGGQERTIRRWLREFEAFHLVKWISPHVCEVI
jgi:hypothetical protein